MNWPISWNDINEHLTEAEQRMNVDISLDEFGLTQLIMQAYINDDTTKHTIEIDHNAFWYSIPYNGNCKFLFATGDTNAEIFTMYSLTPSFTRSVYVKLLGTYTDALSLDIDITTVDDTTMNRSVYKFNVLLEGAASLSNDRVEYTHTYLQVTPKT